MAPIISLETYKFARDERFRPWWINDRKNIIIYTFYDYVANDKEACQLLRRKFSGETSMIIRTLATENFAPIMSSNDVEQQENEEEKKWIVLEVLIQPERSYMMALKRGLQVNRDQQVMVVPAIPRNASGAYMLMRFSGLPFDKTKNNNHMNDTYDDEEEVKCVNKVRKSIGTLFPYWRGEKIRIMNVFPETVDEQDAVRFKGSVVAVLDGEYYIPQKNVESGLAYLSAYDIDVKFEYLGPIHYSAFCSTCCKVDSHLPEHCKYFEKDYPGGSFF